MLFDFHSKLLLNVCIAGFLWQAYVDLYPLELFVEQDFRLFDGCLDLLNDLYFFNGLNDLRHSFCERILFTEKFIKEFDILSWLCFALPDTTVCMASYMYISILVEAQLLNSVHTNNSKILIAISHFFQCFCSLKALYS